MLEDVAFRIARDGVAKSVLYDGKPVVVDGKRLYEVKYGASLLMKLLAARDREKYGETKVIELNLKDWDGDYRKLSEKSVRTTRDFACRRCTSGSGISGEAARQPVKALPAAVKRELVEQFTAESEAGR